MDAAAPQRTHEYRTHAMDPDRWERFTPRVDDIFVCTSYKAGTTWTQTLCALLIFQRPELPEPLSRLSPWLELTSRSSDEVIAMYEAQSHRRFIKTHTPLDGIPYYPDATYLFCGRDPRDVFLSMRHHMGNVDREAVAQRRAAMGMVAQDFKPPDMPLDADELFKVWLTVPAFPWEKDGFPMWSFFSHAKSYWDHRQLPNLHFLHYADLQADLEGQMRRLAGLLGITVDEARLPELVQAARFDHVKARADQFAPEADLGLWKNTREFFHKGQSGQWQQVLSAESLALYDEVKRDRMPPELTDWLERGSLAAGDPKLQR